MSYRASQSDSQGGSAEDLDTFLCRGGDLFTGSIEQWTAGFQEEVFRLQAAWTSGQPAAAQQAFGGQQTERRIATVAWAWETWRGVC